MRCRGRTAANYRGSSSLPQSGTRGLTGKRDPLDAAPWLQRSLRMRNPCSDPMNYIQMALLRRLRSGDASAATAALREAVLLSVVGIAAGLRNTG